MNGLSIVLSRIDAKVILPLNVRVRLIFFVIFAFNTYYFLYFQTFSQGVLEERSIGIYFAKLISIIFLISSFLTTKIKLNILDILFISFCFMSALSYLVGGIFWGFNDNLYINFLLFSFWYPIIINTNDKHKIYFIYEKICILIFLQVILELFLNELDIALWEGGLFIGGLGNPTSFAFVSIFCLIYITFCKNSFTLFSKVLFGFLYIYSAIMTKALFPILLTLLLLPIAAINIKSARKKILFWLLALVTLVLFLIVCFRGGLLENKLNSLLYFIGLSDNYTDSRSVSLRVENINLVKNFIAKIDFEWWLGHYQEMAYYPVDSQFISITLSFGFVMLVYFIFINFYALIMVYKDIKNENGLFVFIGLLFCNFMFINNRILDYFPLGFIYISLIALASRSRSRYP